MSDRSSLVNQLRIERSDEREARAVWPWWLGGVALAGGIAATAWLMLGMSDAVPVGAAEARSAAVAVGSSAAEAGRVPGTAEAPAPRGSMLDASGYVVARRQATVSSKITGKVVEATVEEGQRVEAGEVVARLDDANARAQVALASAQLEQAAASRRAASVDVENATSIFERNESLYSGGTISAQAFDTAKASYDAARAAVDVATQAVKVAEANLALARRNLEDTIVRAPFAGVVTVKAAQEGEMVSPVSGGGGFTRTGIGTIVDMDSLEVEVDVSESFINRVRVGQDVDVRLNAYPDLSLPGHVIAIIPTADRAKATVTVRIGLLEEDERILPEMGVRVSFFNEARH